MRTNNKLYNLQNIALTVVKTSRRLRHALSPAVLLALVLPAGVMADGLQTLDCVINPSEVADLGTAVPGLLRAVRVERSDFVHAGDVVAELEAGVEQAAVDLARARAELNAEVKLRRVNAAFGQRQQERSEGLFQRKALSTNDMDQRETEAKMAQFQLRQALDNQRLAKLELRRAEEVLRRRTIQSPFTGVVMERFKTVGEYVEDQPVVRVAQLDPLHVEVVVPVEMLGEVQIGMVADVWSDVVGTTWRARVSHVDRVADAASGTYVARLGLPNPDYRIPAGLHCRMQFVEAGEEPPAVDHAPSQGSGLVLDKAPQQMPDRQAVEDPAMAADSLSDGLPAEMVDREQTSKIQRNAPEMPVKPDAAMITGNEKTGLPECRWAGPFSDQNAADTQGKALRAAGFEVETKRSAMSVPVGYKVVSQPLSNRSAAKKLISSLRAAGITDLYLQKKSNRVWRISLGLYKRERAAKRRVADLGNKGFDAAVVPWRKSMIQFFLVVRGVAQDGSRALLAGLPTPAAVNFADGACARLAGR